MGVSVSQAIHFFDSRAGLMRQSADGLFPSVKLAQAAIESDYGTSELYKKSLNLFGIKLAGQPYHYEYVLANDDKPNEKFRKYNSELESAIDHTRWVKANSDIITKGAVLAAKTPEEQIDAIAASGYATRSYAGLAKQIIRDFNLKQYDVGADKKNNFNPTNGGIIVVALFWIILISVFVYSRVS